MIPLRDNVPSQHQPWTVWGLLAANILVFMQQASLPPRQAMAFAWQWGVVPARALADLPGELLPALSHMFLHGSWLHLLMNMWILWIFADNVEEVMGSLRFLLFYLLCGVVAVATQVFFSPDAQVPVVGASGAIAGVMGAYFLLYPKGRVLLLIPILIIPYMVEIPAAIFLGVWFALQFLSGVASGTGAGQGGGVAFWAHAGGFIAGALLLRLFRRGDRPAPVYHAASRRYVVDASQAGFRLGPGPSSRWPANLS